jgi:DNA-binding response OmpR family regulator
MAGRVLIVEEDAVLQRALRRGLAERGYVSMSARSRAELRRVLAIAEPDLIVLDIELPDADGRDVLHGLKLDPSTAGIPVIVWSGRDAWGDEATAMKLGARAYVTKADVQPLVSAVASALDSARLEASLPG